MSRIPPGRTVALGALLSIADLVGATLIVELAHPGPTGRVLVFAGAIIIGIVGGVMMLKDLSP